MANKAEDYTDLDINALNAISNYVAPFLNASLQTDKAKMEIYKLVDYRQNLTQNNWQYN